MKEIEIKFGENSRETRKSCFDNTNDREFVLESYVVVYTPIGFALLTNSFTLNSQSL